MAQNSNVRNWLAKNPKMIGALWMLLLILAETGSAVAGGGGAMAGP